MLESPMDVDKTAPVYNVQCASSSDFVVGRQTNFNAPVTIIANGSTQSGETADADQASTGVVLCSRLLAQDTARAVAAAKCQQSQQPTFIYLNGDKIVGTSEDTKVVRLYKPISCRKLWKASVDRAWLGVPVFVWVIIGIAIVCSLIGALVQISSGSDKDLISADSPPDEDCKVFIGNTSHRIITRREWGGRNATSRVRIDHPVPYVIISHTVSAFCYETETCSSIMRTIQKDTMSRTPAFADTPFNFLVGGDGNVYEARGWFFRSPHEGFVNNKNIDISFIGDFSIADIPTATQVDAVKELLEHGLRLGYLADNYLLLPHNATQSTLSPGKHVYEVISKFPHFTPRPPPQPKKKLKK